MKGDKYFNDVANRKNSTGDIKTSMGLSKAYRAWVESNRYGSDCFEVSDLPFRCDVHDFVEALRAAGVDEFCVTDRSTDLMDVVHALAAEGCVLVGLCKVTRTDTRYTPTEVTVLNGIRFALEPASSSAEEPAPDVVEVQYEVYEDDGDGLYLCILSADRSRCLRVFGEWEYGTVGNLSAALERIREDPTVYEDWWGDLTERLSIGPQRLYDEGLGALIADNSGLYVERMGSAARRAFGV